MRRQVRVVGAVFLLVGCLFFYSCTGVAKKGLPNEFFAMDTGTIDLKHRTAREQVEMLKELGYAGIGYWEGNPKRRDYGLAEMLDELDRCGLKAFPVYFGACLDGDKPKYEAGLKEAIELLNGRDTAIWLHIWSEKYKSSSPEGDERAVEIVREIADMAEVAGLRVILYPHVNEWVERTDDALRVVKKVGRANIGLSLNLYHWLRIDGEENMEELMERVMPYLFTVTINGSSREGSIETLDKGDFDVYKFLRKLDELGYSGPIGLQGWGIGGDVHENLARSMKAWRRLSRRIAAEKKR
ncbi:MAG: sugar phosphate isomerase/epimerase [Planctomycetota bacterium]|nr:MAG: sugar phosphate isomerase/epimerase [Planctomycetota bacterium]